MNEDIEPTKTSNSWRSPAIEEPALKRYFGILRERVWIVVVITLITSLAAIAYVAFAPKVYQSQAQLLITPVATDSSTGGITTLGLITESSDPTRPVQTAAQIVTAPEVSAEVNKVLANDPKTLSGSISATPVANSNIVAVTADGPTPSSAQKLANTYAINVIRVRTRELHEQIGQIIGRLKIEAQNSPQTASAINSPQSQLAQLQTLQAANDPTIQVASFAPLPKGPSSPKILLSIIAGIIGGLVLGMATSFSLHALDPRLRREEQLLSRYQLPVLTRVPKETSRKTKNVLLPEQLSGQAVEGYRLLRISMLANRESPTSNAILITGSSVSEGKTTTALNLALSLATSGMRVIFIEGDLRHPSVRKAVTLNPDGADINSVLLNKVSVEQGLRTTADYDGYLRFLPAADGFRQGSPLVSDQFLVSGARRIVERAKRLADFVIIDSPPLGSIVDALPFARLADEVILTVHLGRTRLTDLSRATELLARNNITPAGFVVIGVLAETDVYYYQKVPA